MIYTIKEKTLGLLLPQRTKHVILSWSTFPVGISIGIKPLFKAPLTMVNELKSAVVWRI